MRGTKLPQTCVTTHVADVSIEAHYQRFRDELIEQQQTDKVHLLFNNAGISGSGNLVVSSREAGAHQYLLGRRLSRRAYLSAADAEGGRGTSSTLRASTVSGPRSAWACRTPYSAAKFAVKGITEALINDLRLNAPHIMLGGDARPYRHLHHRRSRVIRAAAMS